MSTYLPSGLPAFLAPLAARAASGGEVLLATAGTRDAPPMPPPGQERRSAVLVLVAGTGPEDAAVVLEERGHALRSQPAQFSLPGGGEDPTDRDGVHTALREAQEETGLHPGHAHVLGAFAPIAMPWRGQAVTPVLAWSPHRPPLAVQDPIEVERLVWARLQGPGSLTDPAVQVRGLLEGRDVGPAFDLPGDAFVWGFTAMILARVIDGVGLHRPRAGAAVREIPAQRRRTGRERL